jgi:hypothetical protein
MQDTARGDVFLRQHHIFDFAIIGGILPSTTRDHPTTHTGILKRLGKVTTSISALCIQCLRSMVEDTFEFRPRHTSLNGDSLIRLAEINYPVHVDAHVQHDAAVN